MQQLGRQPRLTQGFTLLELLVVLLIIGIVVSLATLSVGGNENRALHDEAQRLSALLDLASQESVLNGREMALQVDEQGYEFLIYDDDKQEWTPLEDDEVLRPRELPEDMQISAVVEGQQPEEGKFGQTQASRIWILSSGEMSPFTLSIKLKDGAVYELHGDMLGALTLKQPGAES
jgi:general secretion pathway protein H